MSERVVCLGRDNKLGIDSQMLFPSMPNERRKKAPEPIGEAVRRYLDASGLGERLEQA